MTWKALWVSIGLALAWTAAALSAVSYVGLPAGAKLRSFVAEAGHDRYSIEAHEARVEGFCTVFVRDGERIAAVCGTHNWTIMEKR